jgi:hypothetical protein
MLKFFQSLETIISNPFFGLGIACLLVVIAWKMNAIWSNWLLVIAWLLIVVSCFRFVPVSTQPIIPRMLWTMLFAAVIGLPFYYMLWTPKSPLTTEPIAHKEPFVGSSVKFSESSEILKARRSTLSKIRDQVFSTKDKPESEKFDPIGALVKYSDELETETDVKWICSELEKHGFGNPFQQLEASSQHALQGEWLQFLQEARVGTEEIRSAHDALVFAETKWSGADKFKKGRDAALERLRTEDRRRIEASGSQTITPSGFGNTEIWVVKKLTVYIQPDAGIAPYTHMVSLITKDAIIGAVIEIIIEIPQSANPTIEIRNGTYSGTLLDTVSGSSGSKTHQKSSYHFNGTAWVKSLQASPTLPPKDSPAVSAKPPFAGPAPAPKRLTIREKSAEEILVNLKGITPSYRFREKVEQLYLGRWTREPGWQATVRALPSKLSGRSWFCSLQEVGSGTHVMAVTVQDVSMLRPGDSVTVSGRISDVSILEDVSLEDAVLSGDTVPLP